MEHSAVILYLELNLNTKTIKFSCLWRVLCILTVIKDEIVCWSRHEKTKNAITSGDKCTFACRCLLQRNYCLLLLLQAKETVTIKRTLYKIYFHLKRDLWLKALTIPSWDLTEKIKGEMTWKIPPLPSPITPQPQLVIWLSVGNNLGELWA